MSQNDILLTGPVLLYSAVILFYTFILSFYWFLWFFSSCGSLEFIFMGGKFPHGIIIPLGLLALASYLAILFVIYFDNDKGGDNG